MIKPQFKFLFEVASKNRDETSFKVGSIVDQLSNNEIFEARSFLNQVHYSPDQSWTLLIEHMPRCLVLLNNRTSVHYRVGFLETLTLPKWESLHTLSWLHVGINDIRQTSTSGARAERFTTQCVHKAGGPWEHQVHFISSEKFIEFAKAQKDLMNIAKDKKLWLDASFKNLDAGMACIASGKPWASIFKLAGGLVTLTQRYEKQSYVVDEFDLLKYVEQN